MKIKIAKSAGFCFGVERAVKLAYGQKGQTHTYTLGPIIHNETVTNELKEHGIHSIENISDVKECQRLIVRCHGVVPEVYTDAKEREIHIVDTTCPYVKKIHRLVKKHTDENKTIILIGDKSHPEIIGINGWANNSCIIVKDNSELPKLSTDREYFVVAQTTYKINIVEDVIRDLDKNNIKYKFVNTICDATSQRQVEADKIARKVDFMIVIGSPYSSNTQKLYEICKSQCNNTVCIQHIQELDIDLLKDVECVGITAGASTPHHIIEEVAHTIQLKFN
ncbi:MAG: 4-hydroxy-3-methylbut-2-enyl diphosphate reductase [Epulopiscium sp. Nele67-Bin005]|nr:MAG: 4-hydroxy-3-methylbut-2-enyl diphosphate reductase [Epulopiscium sp. Nele67-Bin005]